MLPASYSNLFDSHWSAAATSCLGLSLVCAYVPILNDDVAPVLIHSSENSNNAF